MKILNDFAIALVHPKRYRELLNNSVGRVILYVIIIMLISSVSLISATKTLTRILAEYYESNIPEFTFENQILKADDNFDLELAGTKIVIDTSRQFSKDDFGDAYGGVIFDGDSMLVKQGSVVEDILYSKLTDGEDITLTKESMYEYKGIAKNFIRITAVIMWLFSIPVFLLGALIIAAIGQLALSFMGDNGMRIPFGKVYKLALYSRSLPIVLTVILSMFVNIPPMVGMFISIIMLIKGLVNSAYTADGGLYG